MKYVMSLRITRKDYCSSKIFRYGLLNVLLHFDKFSYFKNDNNFRKTTKTIRLIITKVFFAEYF